MNFKKIGLSAAIAATTVVGGLATTAPAEAAIIAGSRLSLANVQQGGVNFNATTGVLDFFSPDRPTDPGNLQRIGLGASTGSFADVRNNPNPDPTIQDLTLVNQGAGIFKFSGNFVNFISNIDVPGPGSNNVGFDLTEFVFNSVNGDATLVGLLKRGTDTIAARGIFTSQTNLGNPSTYSLTITAVPTPALLPGLVGLGMAALRKRKGEQSEQPEAVKA